MFRDWRLLALILAGIIIGAFGFFIQLLRYEPLTGPTAPQEPAALSAIPLFPDDPVIGFPRAPITLVAFEDLGCPPCRDGLRILQALVQKHPKSIRIIWKGLSVTRVPYSSDRAQAYAWCAAAAGVFEPFLEAALAEDDAILAEETLRAIPANIGKDATAFDRCLSGADVAAAANRTADIARAAQIQQVPTIFLNNKQIQAPATLDGWEMLLGLRSP